MIPWKTQSTQMLRISKCFLSFLCIILFVNTSCSKKEPTITKGEWLTRIVEKANIPAASNATPYFLNITKENELFSIVQASVEWQLIDTKKPLVLDSVLTKEFIAYTMVNLMNEDLDASAIKDSTKSSYPDHCAKAVSLGIFQLDQRGLFKPTQVVNEQTANEILEKVLGYINDYEGKDKFDIQLNDQIIDIDVPLEFDEVNKKIIVKENPSFNENDLIHWSDGQEQYYRVEKIQAAEDVFEIELSEVDYYDLVDEVEVDGSFEVDFSKASITSAFKEVKPGEVQLEKMARREFELGAFSGTFQVDQTGIQLQLKKSVVGGELVSEIKLYDVKPTIRWKSNQQGIQDAYLNVKFSTLESLKLHNTNYKNYYSDFKTFKGKDFISKVLSSFHTSDEMDGIMIPICDIQVPIPNLPILTLGLKLQVHIYTSGKIELVLTNQHDAGLEIRNNKLRTFYDNTHDLDFILKASANTTLGVTASLMASKISLVDIGIKGGIEGRLLTTVHLYEENGELVSHAVDVPLDSVVEASANRDDVKVCGDMKMNLILKVVMNSGRTLANKLGLTKTLDVLNSQNASLIPTKRTHLENWQFIEKCTREKRKSKDEKASVETNKIILERVNYLLKVNEGRQINIEKLPRSYTKDMLEYQSNDSTICTVDGNGIVTGLQKGSCTIQIKTKDNVHSTLCYILVS